MSRTLTLLVAATAASMLTAGGGGWTVQPTPNPRGSDSVTTLVSVSCWSPSSCTAVGEHIDKAGTETTLAERWNGSRWYIQRTPLTFTGFGAVSCRGPRDCIAVGGTGPVLAERWDGSRWSVLRPVTPRDGTEASLDSVSCTSASACVAVGAYFFHGLHQHQLAERWNGRTWTRLYTPDPRGDGAFFGVSCSSARACTAVGNYTRAKSQYAFAERWNGRSWAVQHVPGPRGHTMLFGVSCPSARSCTSVGMTMPGAATEAVAATWNGRSWSLTHPGVPPGLGAAGDELHGISCRSAGHCIAVGQYDRGGIVTLALAERWTGSRWVVQRTPGSVSQNSNLWSVSCPAPAGCTAVGERTGPVRNTLTLAERSRTG